MYSIIIVAKGFFAQKYIMHSICNDMVSEMAEPGGKGGGHIAHSLPYFGRSVNPISTIGGTSCPTLLLTPLTPDFQT